MRDIQLAAVRAVAAFGSFACLMVAGAPAAEPPPRALVAAGIAARGEGRFDESMRMFQRAAKAGDADAMYRVGRQFKLGEGVKPDYALARRWFEEGAKRGSEYAMAELGWLYEEGKGVSKSSEWALNWYGAAAKRGSSYAMFRIGWMFDEGSAAKREPEIARRWYTEAANRGDSMAMNNLGSLLGNGEGVTVDLCAAERWYERAVKADQTNDTALFNFGSSLVRGHCNKPSPERGRKLLEAAAKLGNTDAQSALVELDQPSPRASNWTASTTRTEYEIRYVERYEPPPPPPSYTPPISAFYGEPCWGCAK